MLPDIVLENYRGGKILLGNKLVPSFGKTREEISIIKRIYDYIEIYDEKTKGVDGSNLYPLEEVRLSKLEFEYLPRGKIPVAFRLGAGALVRYLGKNEKSIFLQQVEPDEENGFKIGELRSISPSHPFYRTPLLLAP